MAKFSRLSEAQAITMVIDEVIRFTVLRAASGMFRYFEPCGQSAAPTRSMM
ncbi:hypothetical protein D3C83_267760 [compost metagenome]